MACFVHDILKDRRLWVVVLVAAMNYISFWHLFFDDTLIHHRYVKNFLDKGQLVYNEDEFVEGVTNIGYILTFLPVLSFGLFAEKLLNLVGYTVLVALGYS
ncbi:MAG: hypothetical protein DRH15_06585 [Deltaproteobacteria bacterium]|nr:MAG: hypothetical protein DRH15_06585 [Deltaproteobacteria bacterium]